MLHLLLQLAVEFVHFSLTSKSLVLNVLETDLVDAHLGDTRLLLLGLLTLLFNHFIKLVL